MCAKAQVAPTASIVSTSTNHCTDFPVTFSAATNGSTNSFTWAVVPVKGLVSYSDLNSSTLSLTFYKTTTYTVFLNIRNETGSTAITYTTVSLDKSAKSSFNASFNSVGYPTQLILTNYSSYSLKNYWKFSDVITATPDSSVNTTKEYPLSGNYTVTLISLGEKGCDASSSYSFRISDSSSVILPNVFTPNGDGANDVYRPISRGITELNVWIYNRYGILISSWDKVKGSWDGHTTSGEECSDGVYFVVLEAKGFDGKDFKLKDRITLIR